MKLETDENEYLILHRVRGKPAFDIAGRIVCVKCQPYESVTGARHEPVQSREGCTLCDGRGYNWIIPTSGHGAKPYRFWLLDDLLDTSDINGLGHHERPSYLADTVPEDWPDHYGPAAPVGQLKLAMDALGLTEADISAALAMRDK